MSSDSRVVNVQCPHCDEEFEVEFRGKVTSEQTEEIEALRETVNDLKETVARLISTNDEEEEEEKSINDGGF